MNVESLRARGVKLLHGDVRCPSDLECIRSLDWIIDAAANPSVLAGVDEATTSRQVLENNLFGTINLLELAKRSGAGFILISTSRVYSQKELSKLPMVVDQDAFRLGSSGALPAGVTAGGVTEQFSTRAPLSLYGSSKLASEIVALEYGEALKCRFGSIAVVYLLVRDNSAALIRASLPTGLMLAAVEPNSVT